MRISKFPKLSNVARAIGLCACGLGATAVYAASSGQIEWAFGGQNLGNTRSQGDQTKLSPSNASQLAVKWTANLHGDVSSTPAVTGGVVYVTDWGRQFQGFPG